MFNVFPYLPDQSVEGVVTLKSRQSSTRQERERAGVNCSLETLHTLYTSFTLFADPTSPPKYQCRYVRLTHDRLTC